MDYKYIEQLLERYFDCQTTLEEEQILHSFFSQKDVPSHLRRYAALFAFENSEKEVHLGEEFDERVLSIVEEPKVKARVISLSARLAPLFKAAAVVAIILTIGNMAERTVSGNEAAGESGEGVRTADTYVPKDKIGTAIKIVDRSQAAAKTTSDSLMTLPAFKGAEGVGAEESTE